MWLKRIYHFFVSLLLGLTLLVLLAFTFVHVYQDEIVALFIRQANQYINTPVKTENVSVSLFQKFPDVAVSLDGVWMQEGFAGSTLPLATARRVYCTFSILDLLRKEYRIREVHLEDAEVFLRVRPGGAVNYEVISSSEKEPSSAGDLAFNIEGIRLRNVKVSYDDQRNEQLHRVLAHDAKALLRINEPLYAIALAGKIRTYEITTGKQHYFQEQEVELDTRFTYHTEKQLLHFEPSEVLIGAADFILKGDIDLASDIRLALSLDAPRTDFQTLVAILPPEYTEHIRAYQSKGELKFQATVEGLYTSTAMPAITADFQARNASFFHPQYKQALEGIDLRGRYTNGDAHTSRSSMLEISSLQARLNDKPVQASLKLSNFDDYYLTFSTKSQLDASSLLQFHPHPDISETKGLLDVDIDFSGRLKDLEKARTIPNIKASGEIIVQDLGFKHRSASYLIQKLNGSLIFNNNDLALSNLSGEAGSSTFIINGLFKNIFSYLLLDNQPITIEADLQSDMLDLDELLADAQASQAADQDSDDRYYAFDIRPDMNLYFNLQAKRLKLDRFRARNITGELTVANGVATAKNTRLQGSGGKMVINGSVDARQPNLLKVQGQAAFQNIYVDSSFWIFKDFKQDFLTHRHLKGRVSGSASAHMEFDKKLRFNYDKLLIDAQTSIIDGQLTDFEPMQGLSAFINEERLSNISFSEITSNIQVRNQTIYLPETIIRSDVSVLTAQGTHTFDQHINYRVKIPVQTLLTGKRREAPATALRNDGHSGMHLFLRITGTTDNYKIAYDTEAVKDKIVKDIRREGQELREAIQNKTARTRKAVELDEEEYFDW